MVRSPEEAVLYKDLDAQWAAVLGREGKLNAKTRSASLGYGEPGTSKHGKSQDLNLARDNYLDILSRMDIWKPEAHGGSATIPLPA